jgi:hypothetical protein
MLRGRQQLVEHAYHLYRPAQVATTAQLIRRLVPCLAKEIKIDSPQASLYLPRPDDTGVTPA